MQKDWNETADKRIYPLCELCIIYKGSRVRLTILRKDRRAATYHVHSAERPLQQTKPRYYTHLQTRLSALDPTAQSAQP